MRYLKVKIIYFFSMFLCNKKKGFRLEKISEKYDDGKFLEFNTTQ